MNLARIDLNLLVALHALLEERSVTRAAARLSVGQPAMSATLRRLRDVFGDPLFVRDGRGVVPTAFAEGLAAPLARALADVETVLAGRRAFEPSTARRTFTVLAADTTARIYLLPLLASLPACAPGVEILVAPLAEDAAERLRSGGADLVLHPHEGFPMPGDFARVGLVRDRYVAVIDRAGAPDELDGDALRARPMLRTLVGGHPSFADVQVAGGRAADARTAGAAVNAVLAPALLPGTDFVCLLPEHVAEFAAAQHGLVLREPPFPLRPVTETMAWSRPAAADPGHRWLRRAVQRAFHDVELRRAALA